jgi:hypothetical protein
VRRLREEVHDEAEYYEEYRDDVDWQPQIAQISATRQQRLAAKTFEDDAADRCSVRAQMPSGAERRNDVEHDLVAQVDERE